ncbi:hypothetical protein KC19_3G083600 [Ceratodon purpureus]|uniref:Uncharacterized protein n=1 Tax=Ceratodon purpureus TaxID=3225 RepID=A0A8T0IIL5_CERPU|nr:hypothetical protein KC19_3G083600 [Ceratodon purpureus]
MDIQPPSPAPPWQHTQLPPSQLTSSPMHTTSARLGNTRDCSMLIHFEEGPFCSGCSRIG